MDVCATKYNSKPMSLHTDVVMLFDIYDYLLKI